MNSWRLLPLIETTAANQMAIDEAILTEIAGQRSKNTLRFYTWKPPAISLGYFQSVEQEVDLDAVKNNGVDLVRRITGGGAVLHDKEITYSVFISEDLVPKGILESYEVICGAIVSGLHEIGVAAKFKKINDIIANGKKISGSAQTRRNGIVLQHGTLLLDVDVKKMFSLLKVPNEKIRDKMIAAVEERVTSLNKELGREVTVEEMREHLISGFRNTFAVNFFDANLTPEEEALAEKFFAEKYSTKEWVFKR